MASFDSLYAHFPFCETKCHYCDFFSLPEDRSTHWEKGRVYSSMLRELEMNRLAPLRTVFLGGGTPSLVPVETLGRFLTALPLTPETEVTMEANPSSVNDERAAAWREAGVNRVSMGVQALDDERLKWLGRVHSKTQAVNALDALFGAGFENVSIDYIVGVPGQDSRGIEAELGGVLDRYPGIRHLSAYLLTLKSANPKSRSLPREEEQLSHLSTAARVLRERGFEHYEISNFARPGSRARHNENYWLGGSYLGIGPSAHGYDAANGTRFKNWASLGKYCELVEAGMPAREWEERLTGEQERLEYLLLRLRMKEGVAFEEYRTRFGRDLDREKAGCIQDLAARGLCRADSRLELTEAGFFLSDQILTSLI